MNAFLYWKKLRRSDADLTVPLSIWKRDVANLKLQLKDENVDIESFFKEVYPYLLPFPIDLVTVEMFYREIKKRTMTESRHSELIDSIRRN